jgi:hypothetical protein
MSIEIELPPEIEARVRDEAASQGQDTSAFLSELVRRQLIVRELDALRHRQPPQSVDELRRKAHTNWVEAVAGQWPGDETDEEIRRILDEVS